MQPRMIQGSNPGRNKIFLSPPKHQASSLAYPTFCSMGARGLFPMGKAARALD